MNINELFGKYFAKVFFVLTFAFSIVNFSTSEYGVYSSMTESIIKDRDLNISNEMYYPSQKFIVTKSYNYPHHHSSGALSGWVPFALYGELVSKFFDLPEAEDNLVKRNDRLIKPFFVQEGTSKFFLHLSLVFGNLFITALSIFLIMRNKELFPYKNSNIEFAAFLLATPLLFYTTLEPGASNNVALLITATLISYINKKSLKLSDMMILGMALGVGFSIRVGTAFYLPMVLWIIRSHFNLKNLTVIGCLGLIGSMPHFINDSIRFGDTAFGYSSIFIFNPILLFETMFSPFKGIFIYSPILLVALIAGLKSFDFKKVFTLENTILFALLTKLFFFGNTYSHGGGVFGARQFIQDVPLLYILFTRIKSYNIRRVSLLVGLIISTLFLTYYIYRGTNIPYDITFMDYLTRWNDSPNHPSLHKLHLKEKIVNFGILAAVLLVLLNRFKERAIILFLFTSLMVITALNATNNTDNVRKMVANDFYENTIPVNTLSTALSYENLGSIQERLVFLKAQKREAEYNETMVVYKSYINDILSNEIFKSEEELLKYLPELNGEFSHLIFHNKDRKILK